MTGAFTNGTKTEDFRACVGDTFGACVGDTFGACVGATFRRHEYWAHG